MEEGQLANPSMPVCDNNGNRITTDILVSGYIREMMNIDIPSEIIHICFVFWLIDVCDTWNKCISHPDVIIDAQYAKPEFDGHKCTVYGSQVIESGSYEWKLKCETDIIPLGVGVIEDRDEVLKHNHASYSYGMDGDGCFLLSNGKFFYSDDPSDDIFDYAKPFGDEGTMITLILNMDKQSVCYKINDEDFGYVNAKCVKKKQKYRLAVTMVTGNKKIALL